MGAGFLAVNSSSNFERLCALNVKGWQILSLVINKESTESFASTWPDIVKKAGMQLIPLKMGSSTFTR